MAIRAARLSIVHDEALSYLNFVGRSFGTILSYDAPGSVNNHVLNSLLSRVAILVLGPSEAALRIPNVIAFGLFLVSGIGLCRRFSSASAGFCGFVLFVSNPFLLEFFSLSRGYGLALAFLFAALLFFVRAEEAGGRQGDLLAGGLSAYFAVLANLGFLLPVLALLLSFAARNRRAPRRWALPLTVAPLLVAGTLGPRIVALQRDGQFYAGGTTGFFEDTAGSLLRMTLTERGGRVPAVVAAGVVAAALLFLCLAAAFMPSPSHHRETGRIASSVLVLSAAGSVTQHALLGTPFLTDRTALFFLPLLALGAAGGLDALAAAPSSAARAASHVLATALAAIALFPLSRSANLDHTTIWRYDANSGAIASDLAALHEEGFTRIRLGGNWVFEPALNFYRETRRLTWLEEILREDAIARCNVVLTSGYERVSVPRGEFLQRRAYPLSGNILLVRARPAGTGTSVLEDTSLTGSIDQPEEGEVVAGTLQVRGWARIAGKDLGVTVYLDGVVREGVKPVSRTPRPDVAAALPPLGDCSGAGYEATIPFRSGDEGPHLIEVAFLSADGRERHYPVRSFTWKKDPETRGRR